MDSFHCPDYEELTIEEKLLVDKEMKVWFKEYDNTCVPTFIFKIGESRIIERLKEKDGKRKTRDANANASVAGRKRNRRTGQRNT